MPTRPPRADLRSGWLPVAVLVAAMLAVGVVVWCAGWHLGADSAVYRAGALTLLRGEHLYDPQALTTLPDWVLLPFTYPPAAALLFIPLAAVPAGLAWGVLGALSVLALVVVVRVCAGPRSGRAAVLGLIVLGLALEPVWKTIFLGQINLILMALVVLDVLVITARGGRFGGVLVGVAAAVKLTPLIFVAHLFVTGRRKDALRGLTTFLVLQGLMFLVIPHDAARYWTQAASDPKRVGAVHWIFNQSLNGVVSRASDLASWSLPVALGIAAVLAVPAVWLVLRYHRRGEHLAALLVSAFYGLLVSPVSWSHHWVWAVPLIVLLVRGARTLPALAVIALFGSCVVMLVPNGGTSEFTWGPLASLLGNSYVLCAAAGLLVLAARELRAGPRELQREAPEQVRLG